MLAKSRGQKIGNECRCAQRDGEKQDEDEYREGTPQRFREGHMGCSQREYRPG